MDTEQRIDRFYAWAEQLQAEMRQLHTAHRRVIELETEVENLKQRVGFLENVLQGLFNFTVPENTNKQTEMSIYGR